MSKTRTLAGLVSNGNPLADGTITPSEIGAATSSDILRISGVVYPEDDLAVNPAGGQTVTVNGSGFTSTPTIYVGGTIAPSVTFVSATQITFTTPAKTAGTYDIYVVNPNGATAIRVVGISYSGTPTWTTPAGSLGTTDATFSFQLVASSDSNITYTLTSGSTLPSGVTLSSNGLVAGTLNTDQTFSFSVDAIDAESQETPRSFSVTVSTGDPNFKNTTLLLQGNGTNGAQNNTFVDSSSNNFTITRNGNTTQGSFSPYGSNWSNYFNGSNAYLSSPANTALNMGTGNWTIECWVYISSRTLNYPLIFGNNNGSYSAGALAITNSNNDSASYYDKFFLAAYDVVVGAPTLVSSVTNSLNTWYHLAIVRNGTSLVMYRNGTSVASTTISAGVTFDWGKLGTRIGGGNWDGAQSYFNGYTSNLRVVKGTAVYTSAFTPSTTPLTAISGTSLLTCADNRFIDNSTNNFTITVNGTPSVQRFNPFGTATAYSTSVIGGSGYFDGSGDYLTATLTSQTFGAGNFTAEGWFYQNANVNYNTLMAQRTTANSATGWIVGSDSSGGVYAYSNGFLIGPTGTAIKNQWNHIAFVRSSGTMTLYLNGVSLGTSSTSKTFSDTFAGIGGDGADAYVLSGYSSNVRYVVGTAVYTTTFTPPTAPLTAISGTSLLANFTNGAIFDNAMINNLETSGNAQISTSVIKYGTGSLYFDGTGDCLTMSNTPAATPSGTESWTIEGWINPTSISNSFKAIYINGYPIQIYLKSNVIEAYFSSTAGTGEYFINGMNGPASSVFANVWTHFAVVKNSNTYTIYVNGVGGTPVTNSTAIAFPSSTYASIGDAPMFGLYAYTGYIDDLRITKGVARYTSNFTPSTTAFPNKG